MQKKVFALALTVATLSVAVVPAGAVATPTGEVPLADAGLDQQVTVGTTVTLDATGSRDPDGRIVDYRWRIETPDGRTVTPTPPNRGRTTFTVTDPGRYAVTVTVTDDDGNTAADTLYVVADTAPTPTPTPAATPTPTAPPVTPPSGGPSTPTEAPTPVPSTPPSTTPGGPPSGSPATTSGITGSPAATPTGLSLGPAGGPPAALPEPPTCAETFGPDCIEVLDCSEDPEQQCGGSLRISGPVTLAEEEVGTYTAVADGFAGDVSFRWRSGEVSRSIERKFPPGEYTLVVTATDGDDTYVAEKTVHVGRNAPPKVAIEDPGDVRPGESVVLSLAELSDPDGSVTSVSWSGGSRVREVGSMQTVRSVSVPEGEGSTTVEVTARDDAGATATDSLVIETTISEMAQVVNRDRVAVCTYYEYGSREQGQPLQCWNKDTGDLLYDREPGAGPNNLFDPANRKEWTVEWERVSQPNENGMEQGFADVVNDSPSSGTIQPTSNEWADNVPTLGEMFARSDSDKPIYPEPEDETSVETDAQSNSDPAFEAYEKDGKSVSSDLNGDGKVDLQDWQERYGGAEAPTIEQDEIAASEFKQEVHRTNQEQEDSSESDMGQRVQDAFDNLGSSVDSLTESADEAVEDVGESASDSIESLQDSVNDAFSNL